MKKEYLQPKFLTIFCLGFSSGLPLVLTASTFQVWLAEAGINLATIGLLSMVALPYSFKFLWAPFIDNLSIPYLTNKLGKRRSWLLVTQIALIAAIIGLGYSDPTENMRYLIAASVITAFCSASQDIVIDAYRIEILDENEQGLGATAANYGYRLGMLFTGAGALYLSEYFSWSAVYLISALGVLVGMVAPYILGEPKRNNSEQPKYFYEKILASFQDIVIRPKWVLILLFIVFYKLSDAMIGNMLNPFWIEEIGFSKSEIATITKVFGLVATLFGIAAGGALVYRQGIVKSLWICVFLQMASNFTFIIQSLIGYDQLMLVISIAIENFTSGMGTSVFIAYLSTICSPFYAATQYALLSSFASFGRTTLSSYSGKLVETLNWIPFFGVTILSAIPALILLYTLTRPEKEKVIPIL